MAGSIRELVLRISGVDYSAAVSRVVIRSVPTDSDFVSFVDAQNGGKRDYHLALAVNQDTTAGALWDVIWSQRGADLAFELWPYGRPGSGTPTVAQPRFAGTATVPDPDGDFIGGEPDEDPTAVPTIDVEWLCTAKPVRQTA